MNSSKKGRVNGTRANTTDSILQYAAAALSMVSFFTTLQGINGVITDNKWLAGLISFGIQSIILVLGLKCVPIIQDITGLGLTRGKKSFLFIVLFVLYVFSIFFSSFFSYVYAANAAYDAVHFSDYNMELDEFLIENTRKLRNYNDAISAALISRVRTTAPELQTLADKYSQASVSAINEITSDISMYTEKTILDSSRYVGSEAVAAYNARNAPSITADDNLIAECMSFETTINQFCEDYNNRYYPMYVKYYDDLCALDSIPKATSLHADIEVSIEGINSQIDLLSHVTGPNFESIKAYTAAKRDAIISQYSALGDALSLLVNKCDEIETRPDIIQMANLPLKDFYNLIYSVDINAITGNGNDSDSNEALQELTSLLSTYLSDVETDRFDVESITPFVECIGWLEELSKCKSLQTRISDFENNELAKTYVIAPDVPSGSDDQITSDDRSGKSTVADYQDTTHINVSPDEWKELRHNSIAEFISLVKAFPDVNQIIRSDETENPDLSNIEEDLSAILNEAYRYNRSKLEDISPIETAINYLFCDNHTLAFFCYTIAVFLDVASLLIGLYRSVSKQGDQRSLPVSIPVQK